MKVLLLLAAISCFSLAGQAMHLRRQRPEPLDSSVTWNDLFVMTIHAEHEDTDHETRLLPVFSDDMLKAEDACCINAHILDYYLKHILHTDEHTDKKYPQIRFVRSDLRRVESVLMPQCKSSDFTEHILVKEFQKNYIANAHKNLSAARNKAVGETIILFHYLFESCNPRL